MTVKNTYLLIYFFLAPPIQQPLPPRFPGGLVTKGGTPGYEMIPVPGAPGNTGVMNNPFPQMLGGMNPLQSYPGMNMNMNMNPATLLQQSKINQCTWLGFFSFIFI